MGAAGLRSRWPRWPVTLAVTGVIIAGATAAVAKWPHAWWWLIVVMAVAAAVVPPALAALWQGSQRQREIARTARAGLQETTGTSGRTLPAASSVDLEARVHQTVLPVPYIHRDEEDTIRAHLRAGHPVLVIGSSMVGKTKMAARIIAEDFGSWPVAIPDTKNALAELDAIDVKLQGTVIWLDDIDRLIRGGGITDGALRRLAAENIIVGTIRARGYDQFLPSDQLRPPEWDVLSVFEHVFISRDLSRKEQDRLARAIQDPDIRDRILTVGLGEYVGAAWEVAEALKLGASGANPLGYALVLAASDWHRCGMARPIPASMLAPLAKPHLSYHSQAQLADQDAFNAGLAWATRDINPNVSLLRPAGTDSYVVYDYALDLISAQDAPIPDNSWSVLMTNADASELIAIGYRAEVTFKHTDTAIRAFRKAASSGDSDQAPVAAVGLGALLHEKKGDVEGAKAAWQQAINSGHPRYAPLAMLSLGNLLRDQGDVDGAKAAYQQAINSGHPHYVPEAAVNLGALLRDQGDVDGAKAAWQQAVNSGHPEATPMALINLALLLRGQGDMDGAKAAWQQAVDSGHHDYAPMALFSLGNLLRDRGDVDGAKAAFQQAVDSGHHDQAPRAAVNIGNLWHEQGDTDRAETAWQQAINSGHRDATPTALFNLGNLLRDRGDGDGAKAAWRRAIDSGHLDYAPEAAANLGNLLAGQGDPDGAKAAYQQAIDSGHPEARPMALNNLGVLLAGWGDAEGAKAAWQQVIDSGHLGYAPEAAANLGNLLAGQAGHGQRESGGAVGFAESSEAPPV
jgi:tetratricopeptide (TPR) repeat protein